MCHWVDWKFTLMSQSVCHFTLHVWWRRKWKSPQTAAEHFFHIFNIMQHTSRKTSEISKNRDSGETWIAEAICSVQCLPRNSIDKKTYSKITPKVKFTVTKTYQKNITCDKVHFPNLPFRPKIGSMTLYKAASNESLLCKAYQQFWIHLKAYTIW